MLFKTWIKTTFFIIFCLGVTLAFSYWEYKVGYEKAILSPGWVKLGQSFFLLALLGAIVFIFKAIILAKQKKTSYKKVILMIVLQIGIFGGGFFFVMSKAFDWILFSPQYISQATSPDGNQTVYLYKRFLSSCKIYKSGSSFFVLEAVPFRKVECDVQKHGLHLKWSADSKTFDLYNAKDKPHQIPEKSLNFSPVH